MSKDSPIRLLGVSLDCADAHELGRFYLDLLSGRSLWASDESMGIGLPGGGVLVAQTVADYRPPAWPNNSVVHLDLSAGAGLDHSVRRAVELGAVLHPDQPDPRWRVLLDPAGHPFCFTTLEPPSSGR